MSKTHASVTSFIVPYQTNLTNTNVPYLISCLGRRGRHQGGGVGVGADGKAGVFWRADESQPGVLKGLRYLGSFHLQL